MGTVGFLRSAYAVFWLLLLAGLGAGVWWLAFRAEPPAELGPVRSEEVKTESLGAAETKAPVAEDRPEPERAYLEQAELSVASTDGATRLTVEATEAQKIENSYELKEGRITFSGEDTQQIELRVTDATYLLEAGVAYIEGSLHGNVRSTGQSFEARRLRWNQATNILLAEAVRLHGDNFSVSGELMRITLETGLIEFEGPVLASLSDQL